MGTWDIGPFDNDTASDFANDLDAAAVGERETLIRRVLMRTIDNQDYLEAPDAEEAVAAAALPNLPADLRRLAVEALARVLADESELAELWGEAEDGRRWRSSIGRLRQGLDPTPQARMDVLFEL
ncbi:DUF4259 domain-containing protein [Streptomyces sp. NPDC058092]|uniref:DUF4259 domain-containing protein n=1 Tax=Streptomyces sp. NPDC058092 TaxID=3346336 RepID=UPI0036E23B9B